MHLYQKTGRRKDLSGPRTFVAQDITENRYQKELQGGNGNAYS